MKLSAGARRLAPLALLLAGCRPSAPPAAPATPAFRTVTVSAGTPVQLVLLDELTSGGSEEGEKVRLALAEPIDGLPAMSPVAAVVSWSRSEGTLGGLTNRPARLNMTLRELKGPGGESIPLSAAPAEPKDLELNRDDTGRPEAPVPLAGNEERTEDAVRELVQKGESGGLDAAQVGDLARKLGLGETARLADAGRLDQVRSLLRTVREGGSVAGFASGGTVAAAMELVNLAGDVGHRLGRTLGGRNIRAYPGTKFHAFVLRDATVTVRIP